MEDPKFEYDKTAILLGMKKPVHILQLGSSIREIVNMAAIAVVDAQLHEQNDHL